MSDRILGMLLSVALLTFGFGSGFVYRRDLTDRMMRDRNDTQRELDTMRLRVEWWTDRYDDCVAGKGKP